MRRFVYSSLKENHGGKPVRGHWGAVNVLLILIITGLGVGKPRWARKRS